MNTKVGNLEDTPDTCETVLVVVVTVLFAIFGYSLTILTVSPTVLAVDETNCLVVVVVVVT